MPLELWTQTISSAQHAARFAERAEAAGWDGMAVVDSQNLAGDSYVALAIAAGATEHLGLGTGVTNPFTRHPAVTASGHRERAAGFRRTGRSWDRTRRFIPRTPRSRAGARRGLRALPRDASSLSSR